MQGLIKGFQRIGQDILAGRNIESYVVTIIALILAVAGVLDDAIPDNWKMATILAALALLLFDSTRPETEIADLDAILQDRGDFGAFHDTIRDARELWVYGPSSINILRDVSHIKREILDRGGKVRFLIQDINNREGMAFLHDQIDQTTDLENSLRMSLDILKNMSKWGNVEYRLLPYCPGFSLVIVDPYHGSRGHLVLEVLGFRNDLIADRMHMEITPDQSQHWFEHWVKQYEVMWEAGQMPDENQRQD
ncbi:MAG: hypothetical protein H6672_07755 [Anaerolineaceae bacterium]|nr:hypothetical protein [Anaerolineaceae bacterium]